MPVGTELSRRRRVRRRRKLCPGPGGLRPTLRFKPRRSSPRLHSFGYQGSYAYHLILNTRGRVSCLQDGRLVASCLECLEASASRYGFQIVAYCFMPDHLHLLAAGTHDSPLVRFVQHFKQATGHRHRGLWQRSYYDHVLRHDEGLDDVARYIWANPVRTGIVHEAYAYPYSGPREAMVAHEDGNLPVGDGKDRAEALSLRSATISAPRPSHGEP